MSTRTYTLFPSTTLLRSCRGSAPPRRRYPEAGGDLRSPLALVPADRPWRRRGRARTSSGVDHIGRVRPGHDQCLDDPGERRGGRWFTEHWRLPEPRWQSFSGKACDEGERHAQFAEPVGDGKTLLPAEGDVEQSHIGKIGRAHV